MLVHVRPIEVKGSSLQTWVNKVIKTILTPVLVHMQCECIHQFRETASGTHTLHHCISIDGVSSATIAANVAHDTAGHCYYIGYEASDNLILNNIGSKTNDMITRNEQLAGFNDHDRATFYFISLLYWPYLGTPYRT